MALKLDEDYNGTTLLSAWWGKVKNNFAAVKAFVDALETNKANTTDVEKALGNKADKTAVTAEVKAREDADTALLARMEGGRAIPWAVCNTPADNPAKTVTVDGEFELVDGAALFVEFTYDVRLNKTNDNITLSVNGSAGKALSFNGIDPFPAYFYGGVPATMIPSKMRCLVTYSSAYDFFVVIGREAYLATYAAYNTEGELLTNMGFIDKLETKNKSTLVDAINEIQGNMSEKTSIYNKSETGLTLIPENNSEYRYGELELLTLMMPDAAADYASWIVFTSGQTPTKISSDDDIMWSGDDVADNVFTPRSLRRYNIGLWFDGVNMNAVVRGVAI